MKIHYSTDTENRVWTSVPDGMRVCVTMPDGSEIVFNFTDEGLITDAFDGDVGFGTDSETYDEIGQRLSGKVC